MATTLADYDLNTGLGLTDTQFPFSYKIHNTICKLYEKLLELP